MPEVAGQTAKSPQPSMAGASAARFMSLLVEHHPHLKEHMQAHTTTRTHELPTAADQLSQTVRRLAASPQEVNCSVVSSRQAATEANKAKHSWHGGKIP